MKRSENLIANSTPLICLSKIGRLGLLKEVYGGITIPEAVKEEVMVVGKPGYSKIRDAIDKKWIKTTKVGKYRNYGLDKGENEAIILAIEKKDSLILNDAAARNLASSLGIELDRTTTIILRAFKKKIIDKNETVETINQLIGIGYFIAPRYYVKLIEKIRE